MYVNLFFCYLVDYLPEQHMMQRGLSADSPACGFDRSAALDYPFCIWTLLDISRHEPVRR
jgi:hypothetical protein